jgi:hypothetical protein
LALATIFDPHENSLTIASAFEFCKRLSLARERFITGDLCDAKRCVSVFIPSIFPTISSLYVNITENYYMMRTERDGDFADNIVSAYQRS